MKQDTKSLIIDTTISLIEKMPKEPENITIRDISREAGIAVSQINYHFQTKENLLDQCVQKIIEDIIKKYDGCLAELSSMTNFQKLEHMVNLTFTYLYENENLSRISILSDYKNPSLTDNTSQTMNAYNPLIKRVCSEIGYKNDTLFTTLLVQSLQGCFLRTANIKQDLNIDLRNSSERKKFIHDVLILFFREE